MTTGAAELRFAINHMSAPQLDLPGLMQLAARLGAPEVEIRNDIAGRAIMDRTPAEEVRRMAAEAGVSILTINALQRFNDWNDERHAEASALIGYARDCGAGAIVLVPTNDGSGRDEGDRQRRLRTALKGLRPLLAWHGVMGLVEPLGFESCSLRSKREAVEAIEDTGGATVFRLTHDTFHHALAGEDEVFAEWTGLVHISGVADPGVPLPQMRDAHRGLVDSKDRIGNLRQIARLRQAGYAGPFSFEPFAEDIRRLADPEAALRESMKFIVGQIAGEGDG